MPACVVLALNTPTFAEFQMGNDTHVETGNAIWVITRTLMWCVPPVCVLDLVSCVALSVWTVYVFRFVYNMQQRMRSVWCGVGYYGRLCWRGATADGVWCGVGCYAWLCLHGTTAYGDATTTTRVCTRTEPLACLVVTACAGRKRSSTHTPHPSNQNSLQCNQIGDQGAIAIAKVLPSLTNLTDLTYVVHGSAALFSCGLVWPPLHLYLLVRAAVGAGQNNGDFFLRLLLFNIHLLFSVPKMYT